MIRIPTKTRYMLCLSAVISLFSNTANATLTANITREPLQTRAGSPITSSATTNQPVVVNVSFSSNGTAVANATVTATANPGNLTANSTSSTTTDAAGNATFPNLVLTQAAVNYRLTFTVNASGATTTATSAQFPIISAAASNATLSTAPGNATYGSALSPSAVVRLTDSYCSVAKISRLFSLP